MRHIYLTLLLLAASRASAPQPVAPNGIHREPAHVWTVLAFVRDDGIPKMAGIREVAVWPNAEVAPCASEAEVLSAHAATLPPPATAVQYEPITRAAVVTELDRDGRPICHRLETVVIDQAVFPPPGPNGGLVFMERSKSFPIDVLVPVSAETTAIRISGWLGLHATTFPLPEPKRPEAVTTP
jgi:hypothetical protein